MTRRVAMMPLIKVTDMSYSRPPAGRVLGYGEIGAWLGTHSTITKGEGFIRFVLNAVLIVFIIKLMFF